MMDVFISTTFTPDGTPIGKVLEECQRAGLRHFELGSNHTFEADPLSVVRKFPGTSLVHNYFPVPKESLVVNIASLDLEIARKSQEHVLRSIDFCAQLGALLYTFHPGFLTDPQGASTDATNYDFQFDVKRQGNYEAAFAQMLSALRVIVPYAQKKGVRIAVETEGSIDKKDHLLLQRPEEYHRLFAHFSPAQLGVNLNIGHLPLASKAFGFSHEELVDLVAPYVVAMEMSHNYGLKDDHLPLQEDGWYWPLICDKRFTQAYKIVETRNTSLAEIVKVRDLVRRKLAQFSS